ncbi:MAG: SWIM zinc finger family protein [Bacteroidota bacterium]
MSWEKVSITDLEARVSLEILNRGREYQKSGHILRACRFGGIITGEVAGTGGYYRVRLTFDETEINGVCNCPYPSFCKHMAALALAWIEQSSDFIDLELNFDELTAKPERQLDLLIKLIQMDPLNYLDLLSVNTPERLFSNSRGVLNLIRNTFQKQIINHDQIEALWERVERIKELVAGAIANHEKNAPELLLELLRGVAYSYKDYQSVLLKNNFSELILLLENLLEKWTPEEVLPLIETLWEIYLDNSLWELTEIVRPVMAKLYPKFSDYFLARLGEVDWYSLDQMKLITIYEFLILISESNPAIMEYLGKLTEVLNQTLEGKLWLIDRTMEGDPDRALVLAKEGIRNSGQGDKQFFRERLIGIHLRRGENKQAAALSFIQFQEKPNLDEYLRLKTILYGRREFQDYLVKIRKATGESGCVTLAARIAFDQEDWPNLELNIEQIDPAEATLTELAELIIANARSAPRKIFEALVSRLLLGGRNNWEIALRLLVCYKKLCLKYVNIEDWDRFRLLLSSEYGGDRRFNRKFGAVLAEGHSKELLT